MERAFGNGGGFGGVDGDGERVGSVGEVGGDFGVGGNGHETGGVDDDGAAVGDVEGRGNVKFVNKRFADGNCGESICSEVVQGQTLPDAVEFQLGFWLVRGCWCVMGGDLPLRNTDTFLMGAVSPKKLRCTMVRSSWPVFLTSALMRVLLTWLRVTSRLVPDMGMAMMHCTKANRARKMKSNMMRLADESNKQMVV